LCPAPDHACNDERFHKKVNGQYEKVSKAHKAAILKRIRESTHSQEVKDAHEKQVKDFWSRHAL
jgi:hypothetical protein